MTQWRRVLPAEPDTVAFGNSLAGVLRGAMPDDGAFVVYMQGDLGAGKTTLCRAVIRALGCSGPVRSPTYTLIEPYEPDDPAIPLVLHLDLYRLSDPGELEFLGLRDYLDTRALWLVEWPERGQGALPPADLVVALEHHEDGRVLELSAGSERGHTVPGMIGN